jgi:hypothetical protein
VRRFRFIVGREHVQLYEYLVRSMADVPEIEVILDRRGEHRRRGGGTPPSERRGPERRVQTRVDEGLRTFGWAFAKIERD